MEAFDVILNEFILPFDHIDTWRLVVSTDVTHEDLFRESKVLMSLPLPRSFGTISAS